MFALYEKTSSFTNTGSWTARKRHLRAAGNTTSVLLPYSAADAELRFFRVAVEGTPVTSTSDILGAKRYSLVVGSNYIGSPFAHDAATVGSVLGTVNLPAGASESAATVVDFWNEATQSMSQRVWLSSAAGFTGWRQTGTFNDATGQAVNLSRGLVITLRSGAGSRTVHLTGRVPTAATTSTTLAANGYTLANINYPTAVTLQSLGLPAAGFVGGANFLLSDVVMTYSASGGAFTGKYWYDSVNGVWRSTAAGSPVANPAFAPGNPILIQRRNRGSSINWTLSRPYTTPFQGP